MICDYPLVTTKRWGESGGYFLEYSDKVFIRRSIGLFKRLTVVNSRRVYGIVALMLSKVESMEVISDKKEFKKEREDLLLLQKLLSKELKE